MKVYQDETYHNEEGMVITKTTAYLLNDKKWEDLNEVKFTGGFTINTPMGPASVSFDFPEDFDLEMCFEQYEQVANEKVEEMKAEAQKQALNQIITPGGNKAGNLIIP